MDINGDASVYSDRRLMLSGPLQQAYSDLQLLVFACELLHFFLQAFAFLCLHFEVLLALFKVPVVL